MVSMAAARASSVGNMAAAESPAANTVVVASVGVEARPERIRLEVRMMSSGTVLIIEDDRRIANWVKVYFERAGFSAEVTHDGESGLALARNLNPNLIILDLTLPRLDGVQLCRILRRESDVPIIMLTAREAHAEAHHWTGQRGRRLHRQALRSGGSNCARRSSAPSRQGQSSAGSDTRQHHTE